MRYQCEAHSLLSCCCEAHLYTVQVQGETHTKFNYGCEIQSNISVQRVSLFKAKLPMWDSLKFNHQSVVMSLFYCYCSMFSYVCT